jgi:glutamyl-tRNA synthetase/glutamyl-Q tRNA(Asp) synthetase
MQTVSSIRMAAIITRFAPAPTGALHLGHVLNAIYVWEMAQQRGAGVLLRIEDHDRERCRPEYETGILDDLDWLGFVPDRYPTAEYRAGRCAGRQSDRGDIYHHAVDALHAQGLLYGCDCTRRTISGRYDGRCRTRGLPLTDGYGWRVVIEAGIELFDDILLGHQRQDPSAQSGDLLIRDRIGNWTYQFAVSVDDWQQNVGLVIRGADLLESTGRQIRLGRMLGRVQPAAYAHHPLIMKSADQKLSKSDNDTGVCDLRARGWTAADVLAAARSSISATASGGGRPHR